MDDAEHLASAFAGLACGACGRSIPQGRVTMVARREALAFLVLDCAGCASRTLGFVTWDEADATADPRCDLERRGDLGPLDEVRFGGSPPVDADDLLSMHTFLAGYEGDLRGLLDDGWSSLLRGTGTG